uniref:Uncharacterized protein n=1 Tax=Arundo donax TaxID=35708 RepID=A0A0A9EKZ0_ARUDO
MRRKKPPDGRKAVVTLENVIIVERFPFSFVDYYKHLLIECLNHATFGWILIIRSQGLCLIGMDSVGNLGM